MNHRSRASFWANRDSSGECKCPMKGKKHTGTLSGFSSGETSEVAFISREKFPGGGGESNSVVFSFPDLAHCVQTSCRIIGGLHNTYVRCHRCSAPTAVGFKFCYRTLFACFYLLLKQEGFTDNLEFLISGLFLKNPFSDVTETICFSHYFFLKNGNFFQ